MSGFNIDIRKEIIETEKILNAISTKAATTAKVQAINRVASRIKSHIARETAKEVKVKKKNIDKRVKVKKASTKIKKGRKTAETYATISIKRNPIPAISLGVPMTHIKKKKGRFLVSSHNRNKDGRFKKREISGYTSIKVGRYKFENAFMQKLRNGRWHIMHRTTDNRYPIDVCSVPIKKEITRISIKKTENLMRTDMPKELKSAMANQVRLLIKKDFKRGN